MSASRLNARNRRALLLGVIVIGGLLAVTRGWPAIRAREAELRDLLAVTSLTADAVERERDMLAASLSASQARDTRAERRLLNFAFAGDSPTEVGALAAQYVLGVAQVHGAEVHSVSPRADSTFVDGALGVELQVHLTTDAIGLFAFLEEMVRGPRMTTVESVRLTIGNPSAAAGEPEVLRTEFALRGLGRRSSRADR